MRRLVLMTILAASAAAGAQLATRSTSPASVAPDALKHMRLILRDGGYQVVTSYRVVGDRVRYVSAERGGESEEIPLRLVDLPATERWQREHTLAADGSRPAPALDPELVKEEAERATLAPEVAPDLRLEPEDSVLAMDTFRAGPELVPMFQTDGELNKGGGHNVLKGAVNPLAATHGVVTLRGEKAAVQMHVSQPEFFFRLDDAQVSSGAALTVDTHGASAAANGREKRGPTHDYVVVRVDVRQDARMVGSFKIAELGSGRRQEDVFETDATTLPGDHWLKVVPREPLLIGEYALVEVLSEKAINLGVWDFGVHPTAPENRDVLLPEKRRTGLGRHE